MTAIPPPLGAPHERFEGLDVLRGLAAVYVMLSHYTSYCLDKFGSTPFHVVRETGEYAVWLFFMISGFVIFFTLERSRTVGDFAVSRFSRLYPAYWATLTFGMLMEILWFKKDVFWLTGYAANMTMFQEFMGIPHHDGVYWTLTVELSFYILMAAMLRAGQLAKVEAIGVAWVAMALILVALDRGAGLALPAWLSKSLIFAHFPLFFIGILIYLNRVHGMSYRRVGLMAVCVLAVGVTLGPVHALVAAPLALLATFSVSRKGHFIVHAPLLWLGTISYSLYLSHRVLGYALLTDLHKRGWSISAALALTIALALVLAALVTFLVERPACAWIRAGYRRRQEMLAARQSPG